MRVVIDIQSLQTSSKDRGIGHYTRSLLDRIAIDWTDYEIILMLNNYNPKALEELCSECEELFSKFKVVSYQGMRNSLEFIDDNFTRVLISEEIRNIFLECLNPDFVLITSLFEGATEDFTCSIPNTRDYKVGVIGYDLIPLINPEIHLELPEIKRWYMRKVAQIDNVDVIYSISQSAKSEFVNYIGFDPKSIVNISSACSTSYKVNVDLNEQEAYLSQLGLDCDYVLYSGACDKRKNLFRLIQSFSMLDQEILNKTKIVLVGKYSKSDVKQLRNLSSKLGLIKKNIVFSGYITNRELNILYSNCSLFVFPSLHEGFGLPVLEAMTCGAPVICSNSSSLPEVIGLDDAMFDPESVQEMNDLITKALTDISYIERLKKNSRERSQLFSWKITIERIRKNIEETYTLSSNKKCIEDPVLYATELLSAKCVELGVNDDDALREIAYCINRNCRNLT